MHPPIPVSQSTQISKTETLSYWKLGPQITGGRWYELFRAAPKTTPAGNGFGYVLKRVNPDLPSEKISLAIGRLGREAHATEQSEHPNVIRLIDAELDVAPFFLVQPWMEGQSLDRFLSASLQLSVSRLLWSLRQIAAGILSSHERNRVHLGLDPAHVLLGKTGKVTLLGWSQSHAIGEPVWLPHDQLQPARYTAPECFDSEYLADPASDVYALGCLIWHTLGNRPPFRGGTLKALATAHRHEIPEDLMFVQPYCPPVLSQLVKEMMVKKPSRRPAFRQVLNRLIGIEIEHINDQTVIRL